jgi:hypothetical protein
MQMDQNPTDPSFFSYFHALSMGLHVMLNTRQEARLSGFASGVCCQPFVCAITG